MATAADGAPCPDNEFPAARRPLVAPALALAAGILVGRHCGLPAALWMILATAALAPLVLSLRRRDPDRSKLGTLAALLMAAFVGAGWVVARTRPGPDDVARLASPEGRIVTVRGTLVESPRQSRRPDNPLLPAFVDGQPEGESPDPAPPDGPAAVREPPQRAYTAMILDVEAVTVSGRSRPAEGSVRLTVAQPLPQDRDRRPRTGDRVAVTGLLHSFPPPLNPGQADIREIYARRRITAGLRTDFWEAVSFRRPPWWSGYGWMGFLRYHLRRSMPDNGGAACRIVPALLLADLPELGDEQHQAFIRAGVIHYLAVSGLHVVILCSLLLGVLRLLMIGPRGRAVAIILFVVPYALALELRPSVVRAGAFFILLGLAWLLGRRRHMLNTLAAAAIVVLVIDPAELFSPGFQLSFLVVLGLMVVCPRLRDSIFPSRDWTSLAVFSPRRRTLWRMRFWIEDFVSTCLTAWLFAAPIVAWHFHLVSPVGIPATIILFPLVALLIFLGATATLAGLGPRLPIGWLWWTIERLSEALGALVDFFGSLPYSHWYVRRFDWPWAALALVLLLAWACRKRLDLSRRRLVLAVLVAAAGYLCLGVPRGPRGEVRITTLAVGNGNTVLVQAPGGYSLLVDCGSNLLAERTGETLTAPALWRLGVARLDAVVLTHADADHIKDLPPVLERIPAGCVYLSGRFETEEKTYDDRVMQWLAEQRLPVKRLRRGDTVAAPRGVEIRVLDPPAEMPKEADSNAASVVLRVAYCGCAMILTADAPPASLAAMAGAADIRADAVLLPHHGERSDEILDFLGESGAKTAVMSVGRYRETRRRDSFNLPKDVALYKTFTDGAVTVRLRPDGLCVERFASPDM